MSISEKPAKGARGFLIDVAGSIYFRVYDYGSKDENGRRKFTDYKLCHCDLEIIIDDDSASLYERSEENILDYSSKALGYGSGYKPKSK